MGAWKFDRDDEIVRAYQLGILDIVVNQKRKSVLRNLRASSFRSTTWTHLYPPSLGARINLHGSSRDIIDNVTDRMLQNSVHVVLPATVYDDDGPIRVYDDGLTHCP